jgi:LuxR family maltose regulon positive regulatory protein
MCEAVEEAYVQLASIRLAQGKIAEAEEAIEKAEKEFETVNPISGPIGKSLSLIAGLRLAIAAANGDSGSFYRWLDSLAAVDDHFLSNNCIIAMHSMHKRWGNEKEERLKAEYERFRQNGYQFYSILVRIEQALTSSRRDEATRFLSEALILARPEGIIRPFVDFGKMLAPLLLQAISMGIEPIFASQLLTIIEDEDRLLHSRKGRNSFSILTPSVLSEREMEVIRLIVEGLSDKQIATNLVIGLSTTKTHVHHILDKLDTQTRTQAAIRAKELKLIT